MTESKKEILAYIENAALLVMGLFFLGYPVLFTTLTTDSFVLPKQILLGISVVLVTLLLSAKMLLEGKIRIKSSPFDLPVIIFVAACLISAFFSVNRADSLMNATPLFFVGMLYFLMTNTVRTRAAMIFSAGCLILGTLVATILSILAFFKIHLISIAGTNTQNFSTVGSLLDQGMMIAIVLPLAGYMAWPMISPLINGSKGRDLFHLDSKKFKAFGIFATIASAILLSGLLITIYMLATTSKPLILPLVTGFSTAFAAISQDAGRPIQAFFFGSGFGTYVTDFTRFKQDSFNLNPNLWSLTFFRSSNFILELLATTGVVGLGAFVFIVYRFFKERSFFIPVFVALIAALLLPFSFVLQTLFFIMLAFFVILRSNQSTSKYADLEFYLVTLKKGFILAQPEGERAPHDPVSSRYGKILPFFFVAFIIALVGIVSFKSLSYIKSDVTFQKALVSASKNKIEESYDLQAKAIEEFSGRDRYHVVFSQYNLSVANAIASNQPKNSSPSAQDQEQIKTLIQRSITSARNAVTVAPQTSANWDNLASIYRSLIGFGDDAEQFALLASQQSLALDPKNPQQYINLGGIYYQLGQWDEAIRQFQIAANLKRDYANAYYNLGHALESKGGAENLQSALQAYKIVEQLTSSDKENQKKIKAEIDAVNKKIAGGQTNANTQTGIQDQTTQTPGLNVNQPETTLPEQADKTEIEGPPQGRITPSPTSQPEPNL